MTRIETLRRRESLLRQIEALLEEYAALSDTELSQEIAGPRVAVISSEPVVAEGFRSLLAGSELPLETVWRGIAEFVGQTGATQPDLVILHASAPASLEEIETLRRQAPDCAIVLWVDRISMEIVGRAVESGVRGILRTNSVPGQVLESLRAIARGEVRLELPAQGNLPVHAGARLSKGQKKLLGLVGQGLKNKEIATLLGSTEGTVKTSLNRLFRSVGVKDRLELALYSLELQANAESTRAVPNGHEMWENIPAPFPALWEII